MKRLILVVLFLIPVLIYLFLQFFGSNEFNELGVIHASGVPTELGCGDSSSPHHLPKIIGEESIKNKITVVVPLSQEIATSKAAINEYLRIKEAFGEKEHFKFIGVTPEGRSDAATGFPASLAVLDDVGYRNFVSCALGIKDTLRIVLVDTDGKMRGAYPFADRKEVDRLILETNILFYGTQK